MLVLWKRVHRDNQQKKSAGLKDEKHCRHQVKKWTLNKLQRSAQNKRTYHTQKLEQSVSIKISTRPTINQREESRTNTTRRTIKLLVNFNVTHTI